MTNQNLEFDEITQKTDVSLSFDQGRRKHRRFSGCLTLILSNERKSYRTETLNISEGGALCLTSIPSDFVGQSFEVLVILEDLSKKTRQFINLKAECVPIDGYDTPRLRFTRAPEGLDRRLSMFFDRASA